MRRAVGLCIFSIVVVAAATSAFAQPAAGTGSIAVGSAAVPGTADAASSQPAAGGAPAAQPALGPPGTVPSKPAVAAATVERSSGPFLVGSAGMGTSSFVMADLQVGWMIGSRFSPFVSLGAAAVLAGDADGARVTGIGARLRFDNLFVEGRVARVDTTAGCLINEPCIDETRRVGIFGLGAELTGSRHVGLEVRAAVITDGHDAVFLGTLGVGFYL